MGCSTYREFPMPSKDGRAAQFFQNVLYSEWLLAQDSCRKVIALWQKPSPWEAEAFGGFYIGSYNMPFLKEVLARAYICAGEVEKAIEEYERLTTTDPTKKKERRLIHPKYHYRLALLYEQRGMKERAVAEYTKFIDLWKNADKNLPEPKDARARLTKLSVR